MEAFFAVSLCGTSALSRYTVSMFNPGKDLWILMPGTAVARYRKSMYNSDFYGEQLKVIRITAVSQSITIVLSQMDIRA